MRVTVLYDGQPMDVYAGVRAIRHESDGIRIIERGSLWGILWGKTRAFYPQPEKHRTHGKLSFKVEP